MAHKIESEKIGTIDKRKLPTTRILLSGGITCKFGALCYY